MKYCRFQLNGQAQYGLVEPVAGRDIILRILLTPPEESDGDVEGLRTRRIEPTALDEAELLPPVRPSKIVCVGRNYRAHAEELGHEIPTEPILFLKPNSALLAPGGIVRRPRISQRVDYEAELCIVIGKTCYHLAEDEDVRPYILGYTCLNDVTARDLQKKDGQWTRAKSFNTFCPVGPVVVDGIDPWAGVGVETRVNGTVPGRCGHSSRCAGNDTFPRGSDCDGYAGGRGASGGRRRDGGHRGRCGDATEFCGR